MPTILEFIYEDVCYAHLEFGLKSIFPQFGLKYLLTILIELAAASAITDDLASFIVISLGALAVAYLIAVVTAIFGAIPGTITGVLL
mmetsp:Transcript_260/g.572  ORF Transcript_260/g.572 Transcript_260/m.572 type:complete len:87 (-) Transcript_260:118-378(-)